MRIAMKVELTEAQREQLDAYATGRKISVRVAERAKMILLAAQGKTDKEIGAELGVWRGTVARWRGRYVDVGCRSSNTMTHGRGASRRFPHVRSRQSWRARRSNNRITRPIGARERWQLWSV